MPRSPRQPPIAAASAANDISPTGGGKQPAAAGTRLMRDGSSDVDRLLNKTWDMPMVRHVYSMAVYQAFLPSAVEISRPSCCKVFVPNERPLLAHWTPRNLWWTFIAGI